MESQILDTSPLLDTSTPSNSFVNNVVYPLFLCFSYSTSFPALFFLIIVSASVSESIPMEISPSSSSPSEEGAESNMGPVDMVLDTSSTSQETQALKNNEQQETQTTEQPKVLILINLTVLQTYSYVEYY